MKFWQQSLMARLILYFLLLSLSIGAIGVYIAYTQARDALEQSVVERLTAAATLKEEALVRWVADQQSVIASIAELPSVRQNASLLLNASNNSESITPSSIENMVYSVSFSSDGQRLVTTGIDRTLRVWNVSSGNTVRVLVNGAEAEASARDAVGGVAELVLARYGDIWLRDTGPLTLCDTHGNRRAQGFGIADPDVALGEGNLDPLLDEPAGADPRARKDPVRRNAEALRQLVVCDHPGRYKRA